MDGKDVLAASVIATCYGAIKGIIMPPRVQVPPISEHLNAVVAAPLREELIYRQGLLASGLVALDGSYPGVAQVGAAAAFAADHFDGRMSPAQRAMRMSDVFVGGLVYGEVFERRGVFASTAVHGSHNLGVHLGAALRRKLG